MQRYSVITQKQPREIVLLRGCGCAYRRCTFCDYHLDCSPDDEANYLLNKQVLSQVTGIYGELEVINSGAVFELDDRTLDEIKRVCKRVGISVIHFEVHYMYKARLDDLRRDFDGFTLKIKLGLETFNRDFRENVMKKGIPDSDPSVISAGIDEANFLFGLTGQTEQSMARDIELGLAHFDRICINIMCDNSTPVKPDRKVIDIFKTRLYPIYKDDPRVDILIENTDFGVGA